MNAGIRALRAWSPWAPGEALRWLLVVAVGHIMWLVGVVLTRNEASFGGQLKWVALAVGGFVVAAYADLTWLLRARWAIHTRRQLLLPDVDDAVEAVGSAAVRVPAGRSTLVAGEGLGRFHRADCLLAAGKEWPAVDRAAAVAAGQRPCGVCRP